MNLARPYPPPSRGTLILWGFLVAHPFGGMTWQVLHHLSALRRLGFDVWYVEDSEIPPHHPTSWDLTDDYSANLAYVSNLMHALDLDDRWIFRPSADHDDCFGARNLSGLRRLYKEADAVLNLCGSHLPRPEHSSIRCLIYLQTDPVAKQIEVAHGDSEAIRNLDTHHYLFTYGENLGASDCLVPLERYEWKPTRPPVCVDWWYTESPPPRDAKLTTIANWKNSEEGVSWRGETYYWRKDYEFRKLINLPSRSRLPLELALASISTTEVAELNRRGWHVSSAQRLSDPAAYRSYIVTSRGEFTVAKDQNVRLRSGWFSDRSACYLAAGRPVITQSTGFESFLPTGEGLFAFQTEDEVVAAIDAVTGDYARHSSKAHEIAREFLDAERVLGNVLRSIDLL